MHERRFIVRACMLLSPTDTSNVVVVQGWARSNMDDVRDGCYHGLGMDALIP